MSEQELERRLADRQSRYPGARPLPTDRTVHIHVDPGYAGTYPGQVAAITAASLFGRMSRSVAFSAPPTQLFERLPHAGAALDEVMMRELQRAEPNGTHEHRSARRSDLQLTIGPRGAGLVIHGSGWGAYRGSGPSPLTESDKNNPFGSAFAVIAAAAQLQQSPTTSNVKPCLVDTYLWQTGPPPADAPVVIPGFELGELWCIGVGSVGSSALFFLSFITRAFDAVLVDRDLVELENVRRSPLFSWRDKDRHKVEVASRWLSAAGVERVERHAAWLDEIPKRWNGRLAGTPDALISAANERNVRSIIEAAYPPVQVYATTGRNWQATLYRHIPTVDACSTCVPGYEATQAPAVCATGQQTSPETGSSQDDVALPWLSYAAGLMTAAELAKLALTGRTATPNRVFFVPRADDLFQHAALKPSAACSCTQRDPAVHKRVVGVSRFASLSQVATTHAGRSLDTAT